MWGLILVFGVGYHSFSAYGVIYGESSFKTISRTDFSPASAMAMQVHSVQLRSQNEFFALSTRSLEMRGVCSNGPWAKLKSAGVCTGFLIGKNLLLTAGHCMAFDNSCENSKWIFPSHPFDEIDSSEKGFIRLPKNAVVGCKRILKRHYNPAEETGLDFALIELDQNVEREWIELPKNPEWLEDGKSIYTYSFPLGTSLKYSDGSLRSFNKELGIYVSSLDAMRGSSGAPVFSKDTRELIGILARGERDYETDMENICHRMKKCKDDECRGEDIIPTQNILEALGL